MSLVNREDEEFQKTKESIIEETSKINPKESYESYQNNLNTDSNSGKVIKIILAIILFLVIIGFLVYPKITGESDILYIDNPTGTGITIKIDELENITIMPNSHTEIELKPGTYSLSINENNIGEFTKGQNDGKAFLNPTKSNYILEEATFVTDENIESKAEFFEVEINNEDFYGPFKIYNDIYIKGNWTYGLDEELPQEITLYYTDSSVKKKIYRFEDFKKMYEIDYAPYYE